MVSRSLVDHERGISIVIPAHDEAQVLARSLRAVLDQDFDGCVDVVVVANGCRDDTAAVARSFIGEKGEPRRSLRVYELDIAGKAAALNKGDAEKRFACTMYLDADVVLSPRAVAAVYRELHAAGAPYASPQLRIAPSDSPVTRAYGRVWSRVPYVQKRVRGVGCFAVSADGRARWDEYPNLLADDRFVRLHFEAEEQGVVEEAAYIWPLPEGLRELVRVRARWLLGNRELRRKRPDLAERDDRRYEGLALFVVRNPGSWADVAVFMAVYALAFLRMWVKQSKGDLTWDRAVRSRVRAASPTCGSNAEPSNAEPSNAEPMTSRSG